ncbi:MAG: PP2C family protein-serine/threonine phosphatase [Actinomycetes bacterium]
MPSIIGSDERRQAKILALLLCGALVGCAVSVLTGGEHPSLILLVWAPMVGAALLSPRRVVLLAVLTFLLGIGLIVDTSSLTHVDRLLRVVALASVGVGAVWISSLRVDREERLRRVTHVAQVAQRAVIRAVPHRMGHVSLAARYLSATEEALIGGDLFEVAMTPHGVRMVVGDVRGKGLPAVEIASTVLSTFRVDAFGETDLERLAVRLDEAVRREIKRSGDEEDFVTAILVEIRDEGDVTIVACGHHPPLLLGDQPRLLPVDENPPLGLGAPVQVTHTRWEPGTRVLLYTDGLVEARDAHGRFFRLDEGVRGLRAGDLEEVLDDLVGRLLAHAGSRLADDLALLLLEYRGP